MSAYTESQRSINMPGRTMTWLIWLLLFLTTPVAAQNPLADLATGLEARYSADGQSLQRIDPDIAFVWNEAAPDSRLPSGPFQAEWTSRLLIRQKSRYRFHAYLQGEIAVELNGTTVLEGRSSRPGWITGEAVAVDFGEKPLRVTFRKTEEAARVHLFWSSEEFPLEPVPEHLLIRPEDMPQATRIQQGRTAYRAHRCNRCHRRENEPLSPRAPALTHIGAGMDRAWLIKKIHNPDASAAHAKMPQFRFTEDEAAAIADYLLSQSKPATLDKPQTNKNRAKEIQDGQLLVRSLGCLACHTVGELGKSGPFGGGDLATIGEKRSLRWLFTWLSNPQKLNPDHRMPVFELTKKERRAIARYLSQLGEETPSADPSRPPASPEQIRQGRRLLQKARCAACHRIAGGKPDLAGIGDLCEPISDWSQSCLAESADRETFRPAYPQIDPKPIRAFLQSRYGNLSSPGRFARGRRVLQEKNCLACHPRGLSDGFTATAGKLAGQEDRLRGQSQALIPPSLTAVGDKLRKPALKRAVRGEQKQRRLPWLRVRMPKFDHDDKTGRALASYLIGHDRIPAEAPEQIGGTASEDADSSPNLVAAHTLVGPKAFGCVACHRLGSYKPKNVAPGTRGSDLLQIADRMRKSYFLRWTRSPLRIVPGMEMPSYKKAVPGVLNEDIAAQLEAVWDGLNDSRFRVPTNPSVVEQFFVVQPGEPARIIRDVFTDPDEQGDPVARSLAVGLNNGHNVLFDLDTFSLRGWTFGDFARQRTVGKSWYWDLDGVPILASFDHRCDVVLQPAEASSKAEWIRPQSRHGTVGRLLTYRPFRQGVRFTYRLEFRVNDRLQHVVIRQTLVPIHAPEKPRTGWQRRLEVLSAPNGFDVLLLRAKAKPQVGSPRVRPATADWQTSPEESMVFLTLPRLEKDNSAVIRYATTLQRPPLTLDDKPAVTAEKGPITSVPGFDGVRLPIRRDIMPTSFAWTPDGTLAFTSLKGNVYRAHDTDGDGVEDELSVFEEGLAAPFGLIADGGDLIVAHKPEVLRLRDTDGDGRADVRQVLATGWGYTDNYHDWTCGIVRDSGRNLYVALGSDYAQNNRPKEHARWRGKVLRINPQGQVTPIGHSFRYPTGLAIDSSDRVFISDQQGVQNVFNEINHLVPGQHYGVPSRYEPEREGPAKRPAVQVPHPWTRSVNGLQILPEDFPVAPLAGQGIGCELNKRFLVRFNYHKVGETLQGAVYPFSRPGAGNEPTNFRGPLSAAVAPDGDLYVGSIRDSGWLGGGNVGGIVRLQPNGEWSNGIRAIRAVKGGFQVDFFTAVDPERAASPGNYKITGYTRIWQGGYHTPDSNRHTVSIESVDVSPDRRQVTLHTDRLREGFVYDIHASGIASEDGSLWPAVGHYTMNQLPAAQTAEKRSP